MRNLVVLALLPRNMRRRSGENAIFAIEEPEIFSAPTCSGRKPSLHSLRSSHMLAIRSFFSTHGATFVKHRT